MCWKLMLSLVCYVLTISPVQAAYPSDLLEEVEFAEGAEAYGDLLSLAVVNNEGKRTRNKCQPNQLGNDLSQALFRTIFGTNSFALIVDPLTVS